MSILAINIHILSLNKSDCFVFSEKPIPSFFIKPWTVILLYNSDLLVNLNLNLDILISYSVPFTVIMLSNFLIEVFVSFIPFFIWNFAPSNKYNWTVTKILFIASLCIVLKNCNFLLEPFIQLPLGWANVLFTHDDKYIIKWDNVFQCTQIYFLLSEFFFQGAKKINKQVEI